MVQPPKPDLIQLKNLSNKVKGIKISNRQYIKNKTADINLDLLKIRQSGIFISAHIGQ